MVSSNKGELFATCRTANLTTSFRFAGVSFGYQALPSAKASAKPVSNGNRGAAAFCSRPVILGPRRHACSCACHQAGDLPLLRSPRSAVLKGRLKNRTVDRDIQVSRVLAAWSKPPSCPEWERAQRDGAFALRISRLRVARGSKGRQRRVAIG